MKMKKGLFWILGTVVALSGVGIVRLVAPKYSPETAGIIIMFLGYTLVIAGLFSLTLAMRKDTEQ